MSRWEKLTDKISEGAIKIISLTAEVKVLQEKSDSFRSECRERLNSTEARNDRAIDNMQNSLTIALNDFDARLRVLENQITQIHGFMGRIQGEAVAAVLSKKPSVASTRLLIKGEDEPS